MDRVKGTFIAFRSHLHLAEGALRAFFCMIALSGCDLFCRAGAKNRACVQKSHLLGTQ